MINRLCFGSVSLKFKREEKTILLKISEGLIDPVGAYTLGIDETETAKTVS